MRDTATPDPGAFFSPGSGQAETSTAHLVGPANRQEGKKQIASLGGALRKGREDSCGQPAPALSWPSQATMST